MFLSRRLPAVLALFGCFMLFAVPAWAETTVGVVELKLIGEIPPALHRALRQRVEQGLTATGLVVRTEEQVRRAVGSVRCSKPECWRAAAAALGCRFLVGGEVHGEDRTYRIELWLVDGYSGSLLARTSQDCEICGVQTVGEKLELSASALRAKTEAVVGSPASITLVTDPPGAAVLLDGEPQGSSPQELELPAGAHQIRVEAAGYLAASRTVTAIGGVRERIELRLIPASPGVTRRRVGWTLAAAGAAGVAAGAILFAFNGDAVDCAGLSAGGECPRTRELTAGAATLTALGAAALLSGGYLIYRGRAASAERTAALLSSGPAVGLLPSGPGLSMNAVY